MNRNKAFIILISMIILFIVGCAANKFSNPSGFMLNPPRNLKLQRATETTHRTITWESPRPTNASFIEYEIHFDGRRYQTTTSNTLTTQNRGTYIIIAVYSEGKSVPSNGVTW